MWTNSFCWPGWGNYSLFCYLPELLKLFSLRNGLYCLLVPFYGVVLKKRKFTRFSAWFPQSTPVKSIAWAQATLRTTVPWLLFPVLTSIWAPLCLWPCARGTGAQRSKLPSPYERDSAWERRGSWHRSWNVCTTVPSASGAGWEGWAGVSPRRSSQIVSGVDLKPTNYSAHETCSVESQTWRKGFVFIFLPYEVIHHTFFF